MLKYKDKKWYQFWQPEIQLSPTSAKRKKNFPFLLYWFYFRKVNIKGMFITGYCSFLSHALFYVSHVALTKDCSPTPKGLTCCVPARSWQCGNWAGHTIQMKKQRGMLRHGRDHSWFIPALNFHMPKDLCCYLPSVFDLWGRGNKFEVLKLKSLTFVSLTEF